MKLMAISILFCCLTVFGVVVAHIAQQPGLHTFDVGGQWEFMTAGDDGAVYFYGLHCRFPLWLIAFIGGIGSIISSWLMLRNIGKKSRGFPVDPAADHLVESKK
jgi:hypothetical protein